MEVTINSNGQAVTVEVTLEVYLLSGGESHLCRGPPIFVFFPRKNENQRRTRKCLTEKATMR